MPKPTRNVVTVAASAAPSRESKNLVDPCSTGAPGAPGKSVSIEIDSWMAAAAFRLPMASENVPGATSIVPLPVNPAKGANVAE